MEIALNKFNDTDMILCKKRYEYSYQKLLLYIIVIFRHSLINDRRFTRIWNWPFVIFGVEFSHPLKFRCSSSKKKNEFVRFYKMNSFSNNRDISKTIRSFSNESHLISASSCSRSILRLLSALTAMQIMIIKIGTRHPKMIPDVIPACRELYSC